MRRILITTFALMVCTVAAIPHAPISARTPRVERGYAPGEVIVKLREPAADFDRIVGLASEGNIAQASLTVEVPEPLARLTGPEPVNEIISRIGLDRTFVLKVDPGADIHELAARLRTDAGVEYAEPNYFIKLGSVIPDDPSFSIQWGLRNLGLGVTGYPATLDCDIKATEAWTINTGSPDVLVAVTDTGVDITHPDLAANIYTNAREIPGNSIDDDNNGYVDDVRGYNLAEQNSDVSDIVGHGTQMAGIIAASTNNQDGISGVAQSKILPVKFFKRTGPNAHDFNGTIADAAKAILYSVAAGASIINASWTSFQDGSDQTPNALADAVAATEEAGALLVCIAGNEFINNDNTRIYPGAYQLSNQIVVAASEYNDEIWHPPFEPTIIKSGYGPNTVHLAAPGMAIFTTRGRGSCVLCSTSTDPNDWYAYIDGTSASAAFVSGVAALLKSEYPNEYVTIMKRRILEGVDVRETLQPYVKTGGRLNAFKSLTVEIDINPPVVTRVKYKSGAGKLLIYGAGFERGAFALVGGQRFKAKLKGGDEPYMMSKVPASLFPPGVPVQVKLLNPDGGLSEAFTLTR
ncbi:MAG TPA: S8 family serine peptidase [Blastocatellia bacterium]|nr:S8 family serine peptidase [Blastocatellia bacterium]